MMKPIYIFGNAEVSDDRAALDVATKLAKDFPELNFKPVPPNADLPVDGSGELIMIDVVEGIDRIQIITEKNLEQLILPPRSSVHDFDLGWQLKYLKKIGELSRFTIIGLPLGKEVDYKSIHSIFKKLVAQDMQGS